MKVLITGGCGFIGSHLAEVLVNQGASVTIYDNLTSGFMENISGFRNQVELVKADIRDIT